MNEDGLAALAASLNERLDALRDEFPELPKAAANTDAIEKAKARRNWLKARKIYMDQVRRAIALFWLEETAKRDMHAEFDEAGMNATLVGPGAVQEGEAFLQMEL